MGGARESFGGSGVIVLADDGRLAAQGTWHRRLARLEGIDHIHLKEGQPQHTVRQQRQSEETGQRRGNKKEGRTSREVRKGFQRLEGEDCVLGFEGQLSQREEVV